MHHNINKLKNNDTMKATTSKNQSLLNRVVKALVKYNSLNLQRDIADNEGDDKLINKLHKQCENAWDKFTTLMEELPKYEQNRIEKSDLYLYL